MKLARTLAATLFSLSLLAHAVVGQTGAGATPMLPAAAQADKQIEQQALALLDEISDETQSLKLPENRIRLEMMAAELLWPRDRERARTSFTAAMNSLAALMHSIEPSDPQYYNRISTPVQLRQQMLQVVANYDPQLALDFLHATREPPPPAFNLSYRQDPEVTLELTLAERVAAHDPQQAVKIAREALAQGLAYNLTSVLEQLRQQHPEVASTLAREVFQRLNGADFVVNYDAASLAAYLLQTTRPAEAATDGQVAAQQADPHQLRVDDAARRDLINAMIKALLNALATHQTGNIYSLANAIRQVQPELERYAGAQAATVQQRLTELEQTTNPEGAQMRQYEPLMQSGPPDALLDAAAHTNGQVRYQLYHAAADHAFTQSGLDAARTFINARVEDQQVRAQLLHELDQRALWQAAQQGETEQTLRVLARVKSPTERVNFMLNLVRALASKGQPEAARRVLDDAAALVDGRAQNTEQFTAQLQIAQSYATLAPARAFEIVEARLEQLNELIAAAVVTDGFGTQVFEQDELRLTNGYIWSGLLDQGSFNLQQLARLDFARARAAAERLQQPETRLTALLAVVRGVLTPQPTAGGARQSVPIDGTLPIVGRSFNNIVVVNNQPLVRL